MFKKHPGRPHQHGHGQKQTRLTPLVHKTTVRLVGGDHRNHGSNATVGDRFNEHAAHSHVAASDGGGSYPVHGAVAGTKKLIKKARGVPLLASRK
jgi:hypothetical protein